MDNPIHIAQPAWPPTTHVDLFVYRTPLINLAGKHGKPSFVDTIAEGPDFPHSSIHHSGPTVNTL
jgi:hypothetical protein